MTIRYENSVKPQIKNSDKLELETMNSYMNLNYGAPRFQMGWPGSRESGVPASCKPAAAAAWPLLPLETVLEPESVTVTVSELRLHCSGPGPSQAQLSSAGFKLKDSEARRRRNKLQNV